MSLQLPFAKLTKFLAISISFFIATLAFTTKTLAQLPADTSSSESNAPNARIGTHLGEGDITFQVNIMDTLAANGAGDGFPVTVMVSSTNSQEQIDTLAAGVQRNGFFPIVRINDVCNGTVNPIGIVSAVKNAFGNDVPIEYGNEVNNQEVECDNYGKYIQEYSQIAGQPNVGPSALDYYNTAFLASDFIREVLKLENNEDATNRQLPGDAFFANAYGCVGTSSSDCVVAETNTQQTGYAQISGRPLYLTEFSLSPEGNRSDAPDTDLAKVVEFIETRAPAEATAVTPLIRNVCNSDGNWLLYVNGKVLTRNGAIIDPATCSPDDTAKAPYYLYPIETLKQIFDQQTGDINIPAEAIAADISNELIDQGYEVSCTAPEGLFRASLENWADYEQYIDPSLTSLPTKVFGFNKEVDFTGVNYPLFRGSQQATSVNDSIEAHFGYLEIDENTGSSTSELLAACNQRGIDTSDPDERARCLLGQNTPTQGIGSETKSAALYKLLSTEQQCEKQKEILKTINAMCSKLVDPDSCALYQDIPGSEYTTKSLFPISQKLSCNDEKRKNAIENDRTGKVAKQYSALQNTPLYLDKAYRLGFIVFSAQQRGSVEINQGNGWDFLFNREQNPEGQPEHEVRIIAFRLPDIGTNKDPDSDIYYEDPLTITKNALTSYEDQEKELKEYKEERDEFKEGAEFASQLSFPTNQALINCSGPACEDPLGRALVNLVNSGTDNFDQTCQLDERGRQQQLIRYEEANQIQTAGRLNTQAAQNQPTSAANGLGTYFNNAFQALTGIFRQPDESAQNPQSFSVSGSVAINPDMYAKGAYIPEAKFNTYLIYPVGYELEQVTEALAGTIKDADEVAALPTNPDYDPYFMLSGSKDTFESDIESQTYTLAPGQGDCNPANEIDPETGLPKGCEKKIEYKALNYLNDNDGDDNSDSIEYETRIHGGLLGNIMKDIQLSLRDVGSSAWHYINSCKTTEEFLLGQCDENAAADKITTDGIRGGSCSELYGDGGSNSIMKVYDRRTTFGMVIDVANSAVTAGKIPASERDQFAQTLWGVLEIEGSPYLRVMRTVADGATTEISCAETINSCGAVGPLQIIQGSCVTESCPYSSIDLLRNFERPDNLCDLDEALKWTASNLLNQYKSSIADVEDRYEAMAGAHAGLGDCTAPGNDQAIQGCNELNYCQCATYGFSNRFQDMLSEYGD